MDFFIPYEVGFFQQRKFSVNVGLQTVKVECKNRQRHMEAEYIKTFSGEISQLSEQPDRVIPANQIPGLVLSTATKQWKYVNNRLANASHRTTAQ